MLEAKALPWRVDDGIGNPVARWDRFEHFFLLHLRPIYQATAPYHGHEIHMRGIAAQSHFRCSHALWLLVLLHQACFDAAPELPMTLLPAPIQRNCAQPWPKNFGCGATSQPLVASRRATLQGVPSRYSNSTMYCVNAWCNSPIRTCSTLSMGLAMRIWMCQFQKIIVVLCFRWQWLVLLRTTWVAETMAEIKNKGELSSISAWV